MKNWLLFYRKNSTHFLPLSYTNFSPYKEVILGGGAMTDGSAFGHMGTDLSNKIRETGGIYFPLLKFGFDQFKGQCEAYFGYAGDQRAYEVDIQAGFEPTGHQHLIAHFHQPR